MGWFDAMIEKPMPGRWVPANTQDRVEAKAAVLAEAHADAARLKLAGFVGLDVQLRTFAGVVSHGVLIVVTRLFAIIEERTGRLAVVDLATVAAVVDGGSER